MMDGSQARKTGTEKELIYTKVVINGYPTELLLQCQHMADFGGENADAVKNAFDSAFMDTYNVPPERFSSLLISVCCDGASVNMGQYTGACTQLKEDRDWLLVIHCANHRLELALKDAFKADTSFQDVDEIMTQIYYMFRNSGKAKRLFTAVALILNVTSVGFVKASGTRFQNHKYAAVKAMMINFLPLCLYLEQMLETPKAAVGETSAKLRGYLNKFMSYKYLASLHFYHQVLRETAHLAYIMQTPSTMVTDIVTAIGQVQQKLTDIAESQVNLPFDAKEDSSDSVVITAKATNMPATLAFREKNGNLTEKEKTQLEKFTNVAHQQYTVKRVKEGKQAVVRIKEKLLPKITECMEKRFESFNDEIYESLSIADYTSWDMDEDKFGMDKIAKLSDHFREPLSVHGFSFDRACYEFRE